MECLRGFDVDDQDIARTLPELTGFLAFMDEMFIQGRVFDDLEPAGASSPKEGSRKTLARIALEQARGLERLHELPRVPRRPATDGKSTAWPAGHPKQRRLHGRGGQERAS